MARPPVAAVPVVTVAQPPWEMPVTVAWVAWVASVVAVAAALMALTALWALRMAPLAALAVVVLPAVTAVPVVRPVWRPPASTERMPMAATPGPVVAALPAVLAVTA